MFLIFLEMLYLIISIISVFYFVYRFYSEDDAKPIHGIYPRKSKFYPFKYFLFLIVYYVVNCVRKISLLPTPSKDTTKQARIDSDNPMELTADIKAFDGVLFTGGNSKGYYFIMGTERCHKNVVNGYFYLLLPKKGLLCSFKLPDIIMFDGKDGEFGAGRLLATPIKPMKKWKLRYGGYMWLHSDPTQAFRVRFSAEWSTSFECFDCYEDIYPLTVARSVAKEPWTTQFFESMTDHRSSHLDYFQSGKCKVESIVGDEIHDFQTRSIRRRIYGTKADLLTLHRSAFFHVFLDNGMTAVVGIQSKRQRISLMELGYVQKQDGSIHPVEWCDFELYQHGECGKPPIDHAFQFKAGGTIYTIQMTTLYQHGHFDGWNWESKVFQRFLKCTVNGTNATGISEFRYRNKTGRPSRLNDSDPLWFQVFRPQYIYC